MTLTITALPVPLQTDAYGTVRVGDTRVSLEIVITAFQEGASPEEIVQQLPTLDLGDVYAVLAFYLHNQAAVDTYLQEQREATEKVLQELDARWSASPLRARLLKQRAQQQP